MFTPEVLYSATIGRSKKEKEKKEKKVVSVVSSRIQLEPWTDGYLISPLISYTRLCHESNGRSMTSSNSKLPICPCARHYTTQPPFGCKQLTVSFDERAQWWTGI